MKVNVGVSNRHVHLKKQDLDILFGTDLTIKNKINQPGQFACNEVVTIKTEKSEINKIFTAGYTTKGVGVGTGLGLAISAKIIEKHGGEIIVNSEVGKGTEFIITICSE